MSDRRLTFVLVVALLPSALVAQRDSTVGAIAGRVLGPDSMPLVNATVAVPAIGYERLTDATGRFLVPLVAPGTYRVAVRRIGYTPLSRDVAVAGGGTAEAGFVLARIAVRLAAVQVLGRRPCTAPGVPALAEGDTSSAALPQLFDQLAQSAAQYRLLARQYPFVYRLERVMEQVHADSSRTRVRMDTLVERGDEPFQYAPGNLVAEQRSREFGREQVLRIPTLVNIAEPAFQRAHCFEYGGLEAVNGRTFARVDFRAADAIRTPDVDGAIYVDTTSFQIARLTLGLTRPPPGVVGLEGLWVTTDFAEVAPGVSIMHHVEAENIMQRASRRRGLVSVAEHQRLLDVRFRGAAPSGVRVP